MKHQAELPPAAPNSVSTFCAQSCWPQACEWHPLELCHRDSTRTEGVKIHVCMPVFKKFSENFGFPIYPRNGGEILSHISTQSSWPSTLWVWDSGLFVWGNSTVKTVALAISFPSICRGKGRDSVKKARPQSWIGGEWSSWESESDKAFMYSVSLPQKSIGEGSISQVLW